DRGILEGEQIQGIGGAPARIYTVLMRCGRAMDNQASRRSRQCTNALQRSPAEWEDWMRRLLMGLAAATAFALAAPVLAQDGPARIALIHGLSGSPLEAYSKQTHIGFEMGLEYATGGTMEIKGRKLELVK